MDQLRKIRRHHLKERLKISKIAKIKSYTPKAKEDITSGEAKFRKCLNVCMVGGLFVPPTQ